MFFFKFWIILKASHNYPLLVDILKGMVNYIYKMNVVYIECIQTVDENSLNG